MGLLDDVLGSAVPQGSVTKPLMIALTALLASRATGSGGAKNLVGGASESAPAQPQVASPGRIIGRPRLSAATLSAERSWRHH